MLFIISLLSIGPMSHVNFKKWLCAVSNLGVKGSVLGLDSVLLLNIQRYFNCGMG